MKLIDLHVHSTASDGSMTPKELVDYAIEKELSAFALTDHDNINGISQALEVAKGTDLQVIPGVELSSKYFTNDVHIVGLFIPYDNPEFQKDLSKFQNSRDDRNEKMILKFQEAGFDISMEQLTRKFPGTTIARPHFARYFVEKGYASSIDHAFSQFLGDHTKYFIPKETVSPFDAVQMILKYNGIPILAHPLIYHMGKDELEKLIQALKEVGLMGIEAIYSSNHGNDEAYVRSLAKKYGLLLSGGTDFHGSTKPDIDLGSGYGGLKVPYDFLVQLEEARNNNLH